MYAGCPRVSHLTASETGEIVAWNPRNGSIRELKRGAQYALVAWAASAAQYFGARFGDHGSGRWDGRCGKQNGTRFVRYGCIWRRGGLLAPCVGACKDPFHRPG